MPPAATAERAATATATAATAERAATQRLPMASRRAAAAARAAPRARPMVAAADPVARRRQAASPMCPREQRKVAPAVRAAAAQSMAVPVAPVAQDWLPLRTAVGRSAVKVVRAEPEAPAMGVTVGMEASPHPERSPTPATAATVDLPPTAPEARADAAAPRPIILLTAAHTPAEEAAGVRPQTASGAAVATAERPQSLKQPLMSVMEGTGDPVETAASLPVAPVGRAAMRRGSTSDCSWQEAVRVAAAATAPNQV